MSGSPRTHNQNPLMVFLYAFSGFGNQVTQFRMPEFYSPGWIAKNYRRAMEGNLMGLVGAFIAVAILLGVGTIILGNSVMDCTDLPGYNTTGTNPFGNGTGATISGTTGWAATCESANTQSQSAYVLLLIVLIVISAVVILTVVRML